MSLSHWITIPASCNNYHTEFLWIFPRWQSNILLVLSWYSLHWACIAFLVCLTHWSGKKLGQKFCQVGLGTFVLLLWSAKMWSKNFVKLVLVVIAVSVVAQFINQIWILTFTGLSLAKSIDFIRGFFALCMLKHFLHFLFVLLIGLEKALGQKFC